MNILKKVHSGQVALIMVLIMTVISAVAVSVAGRSTVGTRVQQMDSESNAAMLAAQAGLEQAASKELAVTGSLASGNYSVSINTEGATGVISDKMNSGETLDITITGATSLTGARVYWRPASSADNPSIFVSDVRTSSTLDYAYDSTGSNGFIQVVSGGSLNGVAFSYVTPSPIALSLTLTKSLRITVLGGSAFVGVEPVGGQFPPQTKNYISVGDVGSGDSKVKYGIEYKESETDQVPLIFEYALFANGSIIQ